MNNLDRTMAKTNESKKLTEIDVVKAKLTTSISDIAYTTRELINDHSRSLMEIENLKAMMAKLEKQNQMAFTIAQDLNYKITRVVNEMNTNEKYNQSVNVQTVKQMLFHIREKVNEIIINDDDLESAQSKDSAFVDGAAATSTTEPQQDDTFTE